MTALLLATVTAGCVSLCPPRRPPLRSELIARTGHDLGPPKAACNLVVDGWVELDDGLSEEEAVAIGLTNNPGYQELLADLQITEADVLVAAQLRNPQINTMLPLGPKQWEFALLVPLEALWLRRIRVDAAEFEAQRVSQRLVQDGLNVVRDVRLAYVDWQLAAQRAELVAEGAKLRNEIARIAEARLAAGDVADLDVAAIRLDALVGTGEAARAARDAELAEQRLRFVLGLQLSNLAPLRAPPLPASPTGAPDVESLVSDAATNRPDLQAIRLAVDAAQARARLAHRNIWQFSALLPDLNARGRQGFEAGPGMQFLLPIFHQNQGGVARAQADAERLNRQFVNRRDQAAWEVRQAYIQWKQAETDLGIWRDRILPQAESAVRSSRQALQENAVSLLLVLETTRQLLNAQQQQLAADAQLRRAVAELERSVGHRLFTTPLAPTGPEVVPTADNATPLHPLHHELQQRLGNSNRTARDADVADRVRSQWRAAARQDGTGARRASR